MFGVFNASFVPLFFAGGDRWGILNFSSILIYTSSERGKAKKKKSLQAWNGVEEDWLSWFTWRDWWRCLFRICGVLPALKLRLSSEVSALPSIPWAMWQKNAQSEPAQTVAVVAQTPSLCTEQMKGSESCFTQQGVRVYSARQVFRGRKPPGRSQQSSPSLYVVILALSCMG